MKGNVLTIVVILLIVFGIIYLIKKFKDSSNTHRSNYKRRHNTADVLGYLGENSVISVIGGTIAGEKFVINNYMLADDGKSSQIDHIVINGNGIFVIETKNYSGNIYGNESQEQWTQVLAYGKVKNKLYNPLKQNATHIYRLKKILPPYTKIKSLVVFVQNNTKYIDASNVIPLYDLYAAINKPSDEKLSISKMQEIYDILMEAESKCNITNNEHIDEINKMRKDLNDNICPRCGGKLVERNGKYGKFYGCSNYPKCKFIKK
jgi:uncharacterized membrane protein